MSDKIKLLNPTSRCPYCGSHKGLRKKTLIDRWHDDDGEWHEDKQDVLICDNEGCGQIVEEL